MGNKGDKLSNDASISTKLLTNRLSQKSDISSKKMFGGFGIFHGEKMFGLVNSKGEIYLKSDAGIQAKFDEHGSRQHGKMPYFSLPDNVFNDAENLIIWAKDSIDISK